MQRIGVFVCWCGSNIAATVDVKAVSEALGHEPGVVFSTNYQYMCSEAGQNIIKDAIKEHHLTGVVICSCSPRMHEATFRKTVAAAGLNSYMLEVANIREQCSWIHKDRQEATEKAILLGRAAIAKVQLNAPLTAGSSPVTKRALVIGGGIAGIQTALDIAEAGFEVDIVEKQPTIGGKMTQIDKTFPTLDCAACILTPKMVDCAQNDKIHIYAYSEIEHVGGFVGNFHVKIRRKARFVDETKCTGCGACTEKCPQKKVPNEFNLGLDTRRAIYIPFAQAVPKVATIDPDSCNMLKNGKCGVCAKVCTAGAIDYKQQDTVIEQEYGAIVAATGFDPIKLDQFDEFAYSKSPDVVSSLEFERLMNAAGPTGGTLLRPSDGIEGVKAFVLKAVEEAGPNPCPPIVVGVGVGGTFDKAALLAKKALLRETGAPSRDPLYAALEAELLEKINALGIGPQGFGGRTTALAVAIEHYPTHIAGLPVAVNINCHVARHKTEVL